MKHTKIAFTIAGLVILTLIAAAMIFYLNVTDGSWWIAWFSALGAVLGIYSASNVAINGQKTKNYIPEMDEKVG